MASPPRRILPGSVTSRRSTTEDPFDPTANPIRGLSFFGPDRLQNLDLHAMSLPMSVIEIVLDERGWLKTGEA